MREYQLSYHARVISGIASLSRQPTWCGVGTLDVDATPILHILFTRYHLRGPRSSLSYSTRNTNWEIYVLNSNTPALHGYATYVMSVDVGSSEWVYIFASLALKKLRNSTVHLQLRNYPYLGKLASVLPAIHNVPDSPCHRSIRIHCFSCYPPIPGSRLQGPRHRPLRIIGSQSQTDACKVCRCSLIFYRKGHLSAWSVRRSSQRC
jgi:hypothetical protein